jgi:hypothetical protein
MPFIRITTTNPLTETDRQALRRCALGAALLLGKTPAHVMLCIEDGMALTKGEHGGACAFCDVRVYGAATPEACDAFSARLSADVARIADTAPCCVYLSLSELTMCYTDGCLPPSRGGR